MMGNSCVGLADADDLGRRFHCDIDTLWSEGKILSDIHESLKKWCIIHAKSLAATREILHAVPVSVAIFICVESSDVRTGWL